MKVEFDTKKTVEWCKTHAQGLGLVCTPVGFTFLAHYAAVKVDDCHNATAGFWGTLGVACGLAAAVTLVVGLIQVYEEYFGVG